MDATAEIGTKSPNRELIMKLEDIRKKIYMLDEALTETAS